MSSSDVFGSFMGLPFRQAKPRDLPKEARGSLRLEGGNRVQRQRRITQREVAHVDVVAVYRAEIQF